MKICFAASSGGHLNEITRLSTLRSKYDHFLITEGDKENPLYSKTYLLKKTDRKHLSSMFYFIYLFYDAYSILHKEKPDYIICTGAMCTFPFCFVGKLLKIRIIYIESYARVNELSLTGKLIYPFADVYFVQWEQLLKRYPKAVYGGGLF